MKFQSKKKNDVIPKKVEINTNDISEEDVNLNYENEEEQEEISSMVEDVEMGAGCVGSMHDTVDPKPSQRELQMEDLLNSSMLNKAKELFDIKKITVKTKI